MLKLKVKFFFSSKVVNSKSADLKLNKNLTNKTESENKIHFDC